MSAQTVVLAGNNLGGLVQGNFGTYFPASDGTYTVDTRDAAAMLVLGATYITKRTGNASFPTAPAVVSATAYAASTTLSNGTVSVSQPDVPRQAQLVIGQIASPGPSAGTAAFIYNANDGTTTTETVSLAKASVTPYTYPLSKGVARFTSLVITGLAGTGYLTLGNTNYLAMPVDRGAVDFAEVGEFTESGGQSLGTVSVTTLACIAPSVPVNATHTYGFAYSYNAPTA